MNNFGFEERKQVYDAALGKWGAKMQATVAIEEMSEVIKEITKMLRGKLDGLQGGGAEEEGGEVMYESPIKLFFPKLEEEICNIAKKQDEMVFDAVAKFGVTVDRAELPRALKYDRCQYDKGFADGKAAAMDELVRCKDCKHWGGRHGTNECSLITTVTEPTYWAKTQPDDFCSSGERRSDD